MSTFIDPIAKLLGDWSINLTVWSILLRVVLTILTSFIIGYERSKKRHSAGLRTFILISLAACMAMILDIFLIEKYSLIVSLLSVATLIGAAMLSGNSILFSSKKQIKGLTTSAGLWFCAAIGLTSGAGLYTIALILFVLLLLIHAILPNFEVYLKNHSNHFEIHLELKNRSDLQNFVATIRKLQLQIDDIELNPAYIGSGLSVYTIAISIRDKEQMKKYKNAKEIISALSTLDYVVYIEEIH